MNSQVMKIYKEYYENRSVLYTPLQCAIKDILDIRNGNYTMERLDSDVNSWLERTKN